MDHGWHCMEPECEARGGSGFGRSVFSDASWHNTNTGHDVKVLLDQGAEEWEQRDDAPSDDGWVRTWVAPR